MIETYLLEALRAFYECGTLSAASQRLHVAEPSVSRAMKKLEGLLSVSLFDRQKNKIVLNESGKLAAENAAQILDRLDEMVRQVRAFDRSLHTISVGACAPGPMMELLPLMTGLYSDMTVSSDLDSEEHLMEGLKSSYYNLILLSKPLMEDGVYCRVYTTEQLCVSVNQDHPISAQKTVTFHEMDGQNFIMYARVGIWEEIVRSNMPNAKFFKLEDMDAVGEIASSSDLPSFSTDITQRVMASRRNGRINVPISDSEAFVQFYLVCKDADRVRLDRLFENL